MKLKIDPDFKNLIPPLSAEEFEQLEQNILSEKRCRDAVLVWKGYIVDGHNRHDICQRHKIPFKVSKMHFESKKDALIWITENQLGRRNLSDAVRIEIAIQRARLIALNNPSAKVRKIIAEGAGLSKQTVYRYMKIVNSGNVEVVEQLRRGEIKIGTAFNQIRAVNRVVREIDIGSKGYLRVVDRIFKVNGVYLGILECEDLLTSPNEELKFADWVLKRHMMLGDRCLGRCS